MVNKPTMLPDLPNRTTARMMLSVMCVVLAVTGDVGTVNAGSPNWSDLAWNSDGTLFAGYGFHLTVFDPDLNVLVDSADSAPDTRYDDLQWHPKNPTQFVVIERVPVAESDRTQQIITILDARTLDVIIRNETLISDAMLGRALGWLDDSRILVEVLLEDTQRIYTLDATTLEPLNFIDVPVSISDVLNVGNGFFMSDDGARLLSVVYCYDCAEDGVRQTMRVIDVGTGDLIHDITLDANTSIRQFDVNPFGSVAFATHDRLYVYLLGRDITVPWLIAPLNAQYTFDGETRTLDQPLSIRWQPEADRVALAISNGFSAITPAWAVYVYDVVSGEQIRTVAQSAPDPDAVYALAWHPTGESLLGVNWSNTISRFEDIEIDDDSADDE